MIFEGHDCRLGESIYPLEKLPVEIVVFHGRTLHLMMRRPMDEPMRDALDKTPSVMLLYEDGTKFRAQRGLVFNTGEDDIIGFVNADRFVDGNRREFSRAPLPIPVTVTTTDADGSVVSTWSGASSDISAGGIKIADRGVLKPAALTTVELTIQQGNTIKVPGALAWRNDRYSALTLGCALESQNQIGGLVARWHRMRARNEITRTDLLAA
jgi:hypothetical protein